MRATTTPIPAPEGWQAERYRGHEQGDDYVCPVCGRPVQRRSDHVVAWHRDAERHRHWHKGCWESAKREGLDRYRWI